MIIVIFFLVGGIVLYVLFSSRRIRACGICGTGLKRISELPQRDFLEIGNELRREDPRLTSEELQKVKFCPKCRRIYDRKWLWPRSLRDMEVEDTFRLCDCGQGVAMYPAVGFPRIDKDMAEKILRELPRRGIDSSCLHCGWSLVRVDDSYKMPENCYFCESDDLIFVCRFCGRVYRWEELRDTGYKIYRCIYTP